MKKFLEILLWILTDALIIFGLTFIPSLFSVFSILTATIITPIEKWQTFLRKILKKPLKTVIIVLLTAITVALFPFSIMAKGVYNTINPPPSSEKVIIYHEAPSSKITSTKEEAKSNENSASSNKESSSNKTSQNNTDAVYRTPSGKRYHSNIKCGGKNSYEVPIDEAIYEGLTPCKRCYK